MNKAKTKASPKTKNAKNPKTLWAVWGNGYGFRGPLQVQWSDQLDSWWAKNGDDDIKEVGFSYDGTTFSFASENLDEVKAFSKGFLACSLIVQNASKVWDNTLKKIA